MPDEAYERGVQSGIERERIHQRFARIEERVGAQEKLVEGLTASIRSLSQTVQRFEASVDRREAVDEALMNRAEKMADRSVTTKQFWIGVGLVLCALATVLITALH